MSGSYGNCIFVYVTPHRRLSLKIPISVLVVIYNLNREVLLIERADRPDFWQSVTGSLDAADEPLTDTAKREVFEETGIDISSLPKDSLVNLQKQIEYTIYPQWRYRYPPGVERNKEHWFALQVPIGTPVKLAPREHIAYLWLPVEEAEKKCFSSSNREAIQHVFARTDLFKAPQS